MLLDVGAGLRYRRAAGADDCSEDWLLIMRRWLHGWGSFASGCHSDGMRSAYPSRRELVGAWRSPTDHGPRPGLVSERKQGSCVVVGVVGEGVVKGVADCRHLGASPHRMGRGYVGSMGNTIQSERRRHSCCR